ncbi:hypothetical protein A3D84_00225 [Candidatus Woesebacteria bacterium RIFCSPHIGHO2_02_FULL_42_20]|uniref:Uncharacterized protein n=1 Tax=Candidatus Woesebacteria bacterium RIFCSPHIGHO2_12_FULL_41_24 TaxID=1802510 RepID=A0A1F8AUC0_9BACT|nr:MAG: hypothetical protein A2W15_01725 [Candidatus Woesebacteria bacterium RBG_16_41_13]OGM29677.1 MAG: hypothetical protein A2873_02145 [Candidatus Woesebacteria bacterium RIFCSPHIGHO2_01_FULL_42_80]OGM35205.1 MAG: hypothetical protein A3D84_00225 [Candidatus Woesebacteria bacterium RIFCSPHIGHO2_02_FULL_42_20]OGM55099.1 MAG: hypothetical protein A3E44_04230 [Candidatus Woesebacteria bacterium RIFCSPHIGHO2_12_FULL_41_24]OGM67671.1 MAG: hypothetical protein A2969_01935 [Candidatus Woesebacteri
MASIPRNKLEGVVKVIASKLINRQYAVRGTASIFLQGFDMNVDDVDVLGNKTVALACNKLLGDFLVEKVSYKESEKFKSYFGKFEIGGVLVEVYGNWQVKKRRESGVVKDGSVWSEIFDASGDEMTIINVKGVKIKVTRIETELKMFSLMSRWSTYWKLKRQMEPSKEEVRD